MYIERAWLAHVFALVVVVKRAGVVLVVEDIFDSHSHVKVGQLVAKVIAHTAVEDHIAWDQTGAAVSAFGAGIGVVGELVALEGAVQVGFPRPLGIADADAAFVFRGERHTIAFVRPIFADGRVNIGIGGVYVETASTGLRPSSA